MADDIVKVSLVADVKNAVKGFTDIKSAFEMAYGASKKVIDSFKVLAKAASDAEEITSKYNTVFKNMGQQGASAARDLAKNYGLADSTAKNLLSSTGDLLSGFGFTTQAALELAEETNRLAVDLASFSNYAGGAEGASAALTKALLGETESAKGLGIVINQNSDRYKELIKFYTQTKGLTEQQAKAYTALAMATEQSKNAIGDYARTSESTANTVRRFGEAQKALNEQMGVIIAKRATPIIKFLADYAEKTAAIIKELNALEKITNEGIESQSLEDLGNALKAAQKQFENLKGSADEASFAMTGIMGASNKQIIASQNLISSIKLQIREQEYLEEARNNYANANTERLKREEAANIKKAEAEIERQKKLEEAAKVEIERNQKRTELNVESYLQEEAARMEIATRTAQMENDFIESEKTRKEDLLQHEQEMNNQRLEASRQFFEGWGALAALGAEQSYGLAVAFKALASAEAAISAYLAFNKALVSAPWPFNLAAASGVLALGLAQQAKIHSTPLPKFAQGGEFVTSGPQMIMVGDNATGRERVSVDPIGNRDSSGGAAHIQVYLNERTIIDAMTRASSDGRLIISQRGIR